MGRVVAFLVANHSAVVHGVLFTSCVLLGITQVAVVLLVHVIRIVRIKLFSEAAFRSRNVYCWG